MVLRCRWTWDSCPHVEFRVSVCIWKKTKEELSCSHLNDFLFVGKFFQQRNKLPEKRDMKGVSVANELLCYCAASKHFSFLKKVAQVHFQMALRRDLYG